MGWMSTPTRPTPAPPHKSSVGSTKLDLSIGGRQSERAPGASVVETLARLLMDASAIMRGDSAKASIRRVAALPLCLGQALLSRPAAGLAFRGLSDLGRRQVVRVAARGAEVDELARRRGVRLREVVAETDPQGREVLRAEPGVIDPAGVLGDVETRAVAGA